MADFGLNEEERMVQQLAHEFAVKEIRPHAAKFEEHEDIPRDIMLKANSLGLSAGMFGQSESHLVSPVVTEELSWGDGGVALSISSSGLALAAIVGTGFEYRWRLRSRARRPPECDQPKGAADCRSRK